MLMNEEKILAEFENEVLHELESELHPRSPLPDEADSRTPLVRIVTILLIIAAVILLLYSIFSYYSEKSESIEKAAREQAEDQAQLPPEAPLVVEQHARISDDVLIVEEPATEAVAHPLAAEAEAEDEAPATAEAVEEAVVEAVAEPPAEEIIIPEPAPITGNDVLVLETEEETWAEIVDASDIRMFYGTLAPGRRLELTGQTPFDVFLGNAPAASLSVNGNDVEMTKYTRSNNIAHFKVMVVDGQIRIEKP